jgi:hypothetical protein
VSERTGDTPRVGGRQECWAEIEGPCSQVHRQVTQMKSTRNWQEEVWRVKEELSAEAKKMGMRQYLAFVEKEAERILETRTKSSLSVAHDRPSTTPIRRRSRKP